MAGRPKKRARERAKKANAAAAPVAREPRKLHPGAEKIAGDVPSRVRYCVSLMRSGAWRYEATWKRLAEAWGVADSTIRNYAAEAARWFAIPAEEREGARASFADRIFRYAQRLEKRSKDKEALVALALYGEYSGLKPASRQELTGKDGGPIAVGGPVIMIPPENDDDDGGGNGGPAPAAPATP